MIFQLNMPFLPFQNDNQLYEYICHFKIDIKIIYIMFSSLKWLQKSLVHLLFDMYHRSNVLCCKERSLQKKKYSNSKVREENIAVVYYSALIAATRKVHFSCVLLLPSSWWRRGVGESWLLTRACHSRLGRTQSGLGTSDSPVLKAAFNSDTISLLVFLCRDLGEQIEDPRMFDVTSETCDNTSVIILKSRLTLQVILPARGSFVTPSLIDDNARP